MKPKAGGIRTPMVALIFAVSAIGCVSTNPPQPAQTFPRHNMSPKFVRDTEQGYYAYCHAGYDQGGHIGTWYGRHKKTTELALKEAADHNLKYPGHDARIWP